MVSPFLAAILSGIMAYEARHARWTFVGGVLMTSVFIGIGCFNIFSRMSAVVIYAESSSAIGAAVGLDRRCAGGTTGTSSARHPSCGIAAISAMRASAWTSFEKFSRISASYRTGSSSTSLSADGEMVPLTARGRAHRDARRNLQGDAIRFRHALTVARLNVRCWENSGKHLLAARISPFDP
jgi:hypothetical protein